MAQKVLNIRETQTKRLVHQALLEMLRTQNINKISIRELCQIASINRSTFYNHYGSQYDVLNEIAQEYIENTSNMIMQDLATGKDVMECLIQVLQYMKEHLDFSKLILGQENYDFISQLKVSVPQFDEMIYRNLQDDLPLEKKQAIATYVQYGTIQLLKEWVKCDCSISPQKEVELVMFLAARVISKE